jgi:hypothetical protein
MTDQLQNFVSELVDDGRLDYAERLLLILLNEDQLRLDTRLRLAEVYALMGRVDLARDQVNTVKLIESAGTMVSDDTRSRAMELEERLKQQEESGGIFNTIDNQVRAAVENAFYGKFRQQFAETLSEVVTRALDDQPRPPRYLRDVRYEYVKRLRAEYAEKVALAKIVEAEVFNDWSEYFSHCWEQVATEGMFLEFGVWTGGTINFTAKHHPDKVIHGFDAFMGLPDKWGEHPVGHLNLDGAPPEVEDNVNLHIGYFADTLPGFLDKYDEPAAFVHIDCDIYSSTVTVLDALRPRLRPGTVIVFDEYFDEEREAFEEFVVRTGLKFRYLAYVLTSAELKEEDRPETDVPPYFYSPIYSMALIVEDVGKPDQALTHNSLRAKGKQNKMTSELSSLGF